MSFLKILEYHRGCGDQVGCFGPRQDFYTLFGGELRFLTAPIVFSVAVGAVIYFILYWLRKRGGFNIHPMVSLLIAFSALFLSLYIAVTFFGAGKAVY